MRDYIVRLATLEDVSQIAYHRDRMFTEMAVHSPEQITAMNNVYEAWLIEQIHKQTYWGWLAVNVNNEIIGGAGLWLYDYVPSPGVVDARGAHVVDVYVDLENRKRGIAKHLMQMIMDWCHDHDYTYVTLTASDAGRPLYEKLGFQQASGRMSILLTD